MVAAEELSLRRLRQNRAIRELVRESRVSLESLIQPLFIVEGGSERELIPGMTGNYRETSASLCRTVEKDVEAGVRKFLLFGVPSEKREEKFTGDFLAEQIRMLRKQFGTEIFIATDVCLCSYTVHGHCGVMNKEKNLVKNAPSVVELSHLALAYAQAGADCVAPSDMMDGRVRAIRKQLDEAQLDQTIIMSYSAKFSSKFYGPFRGAADSAPKDITPLKDRSTYQLDPGTPRDAWLSSIRDANEGADILMVKPGMPYLDVLYQLSREIRKPWAVYQVSGEFAGIELAAQQGLMDGPGAHLEAWTAFVRAGASMIITYGARFAKTYLERI
jgi:porphobilinogen synthase